MIGTNDQFFQAVTPPSCAFTVNNHNASLLSSKSSNFYLSNAMLQAKTPAQKEASTTAVLECNAT